MALIESIILLLKLTLKPCRDEFSFFWKLHQYFYQPNVAICVIAFALSITGCFRVGSVNIIGVLKLKICFITNTFIRIA